MFFLSGCLRSQKHIGQVYYIHLSLLVGELGNLSSELYGSIWYQREQVLGPYISTGCPKTSELLSPDICPTWKDPFHVTF